MQYLTDIDNLASLKDLALNTRCKMAQASVSGCRIAGPAFGQRLTPPLLCVVEAALVFLHSQCYVAKLSNVSSMLIACVPLFSRVRYSRKRLVEQLFFRWSRVLLLDGRAVNQAGAVSS